MRSVATGDSRTRNASIRAAAFRLSAIDDGVGVRGFGGRRRIGSGVMRPESSSRRDVDAQPAAVSGRVLTPS